MYEILKKPHNKRQKMKKFAKPDDFQRFTTLKKIVDTIDAIFEFIN